MTISAEDREADDVSKWVKYARVGRKTPKKTNKYNSISIVKGVILIGIYLWWGWIIAYLKMGVALLWMFFYKNCFLQKLRNCVNNMYLEF